MVKVVIVSINPKNPKTITIKAGQRSWIDMCFLGLLD